ncbi:unnamed protein product [Amoebophrya sp. A120]|nr:unnamed protein product [Amoebophrya sp. A120]|eukprot:GSA120T00005625001.1
MAFKVTSHGLVWSSVCPVLLFLLRSPLTIYILTQPHFFASAVKLDLKSYHDDAASSIQKSSEGGPEQGVNRGPLFEEQHQSLQQEPRPALVKVEIRSALSGNLHGSYVVPLRTTVAGLVMLAFPKEDNNNFYAVDLILDAEDNMHRRLSESHRIESRPQNPGEVHVPLATPPQLPSSATARTLFTEQWLGDLVGGASCSVERGVEVGLVHGTKSEEEAAECEIKRSPTEQNGEDSPPAAIFRTTYNLKLKFLRNSSVDAVTVKRFLEGDLSPLSRNSCLWRNKNAMLLLLDGLRGQGFRQAELAGQTPIRELMESDPAFESAVRRRLTSSPGA